MPTPTTYTYSIVNDCPGGKVNTNKLALAIRASSIATALDRIDTSGDVMNIFFKDVLSVLDKTTLDGNLGGVLGTHPAGGLIASTDNTPDPSISAVQLADHTGALLTLGVDGRSLLTTPILRNGTKYNVFTHNFCDKTTWFQQSIKVTGEALVDSGNGLTWNSANPFWIDMTHGKITFEDSTVSDAGGKWINTITVDTIPKTEGVDYSVNYKTGKITFLTTSQQSHDVRATYWYSPNTPLSARFTIDPTTGMQLEVLTVELQFSDTIQYNDTMRYVAFGYAIAFAPTYVQAGYLQPFDLVQLGPPLVYKTVQDFINESNVNFPLIPPISPTTPRGFNFNIITFEWDYVTKTVLSGTAGMVLCVDVDNGTPHGGDYAVLTVYSVLTPEGSD